MPFVVFVHGQAQNYFAHFDHSPGFADNFEDPNGENRAHKDFVDVGRNDHHVPSSRLYRVDRHLDLDHHVPEDHHVEGHPAQGDPVDNSYAVVLEDHRVVGHYYSHLARNFFASHANHHLAVHLSNFPYHDPVSFP